MCFEFMLQCMLCTSFYIHFQYQLYELYIPKHLTFFAIEEGSFFILLCKNSGMLFSISSRVPFLCKTAAKNEITWEKKKFFSYCVNVSRWTKCYGLHD